MIAPHGRLEFLAQMHGVLGLVVEEVFLDPRLDGEGGGVGRSYDVEKVAGDGGEELEDDGVIIVKPRRVGKPAVSALPNVGLRVEPSEEQVEVVAPPGEVGVGERQLEIDNAGNGGGKCGRRAGGERHRERDLIDRVGRGGCGEWQLTRLGMISGG